jgi:hypothetical protein
MRNLSEPRSSPSTNEADERNVAGALPRDVASLEGTQGTIRTQENDGGFSALKFLKGGLRFTRHQPETAKSVPFYTVLTI